MNLDRNLLFSWIEEDNVQKAYFRVRPLLTAEGDVRAEADQLWPGEGCLRIVPDRNELHSFKNRMRALGRFCVVDLRGLPADAGKIRTNKNYRPDKGEPNQYILYSDTVKPLPTHSFYQIIDGTPTGYAAAADKAVTPRLFIREGDTLYGPMSRDMPQPPDPAPEAAATLFEVPCPDGETRLILCLADAPAPVLRAPVMRTAPSVAAAARAQAADGSAAPAASALEAAPEAEKPAEPAKAPAEAAADSPVDGIAAEPAPSAEASAPVEVAAESEAPADAPAPMEAAAPVEPAAESETPADAPVPVASAAPVEAAAPADPSAPVEPSEPEVPAPVEAPAPVAPPEVKPSPAADAPLPIGKRLQILDSSRGHDETLHALDKPVSRNANLLNQRESRLPKPQPPVRTSPLGGTQLVQTPLRTSTPQPKNRVQELATGHYVGAFEPPTGNLPSGASLRDVANPVENACKALRQAWNASDSHPQLMDCILSLDGFRTQLETRLCKSGATLMQKVLRDRLQDLEAERLTALCELDRARRDTEAYREAQLAALKTRIAREAGELQRTRDEAQARVDALKEELRSLTQQHDTLSERVRQLQQDTLPAEAARLLTDAQMLSPTLGPTLRMSPIPGEAVAAEDMIARLMDVCSASGVSLQHDQAVALLALLGVAPRFGVVCSSVAPVATLAGNIAAAFGWSGSFAHQVTPEQRPLVSARPVDSTPAFLMTSLPHYAPVTGAAKVLLNRSVVGMVRNAAYDADPWPVLALPPLSFVEEVKPSAAAPVSAASLEALLDGPGVDHAAIRTALDPVLKAAAPLSGAARKSMFRFISACAGLMEGGLPAAADWGILLWIVPGIDRAGRYYGPVKDLLDEYPLSLGAM